MIRIEAIGGEALAARLPELARLRLTVFRDFPYLYDGSEAAELRYLRGYAAAADGVVIAAFDGDALVGAATGLPLVQAGDAVAAPFRDHGYDVGRLFYFGESVLLAPYRGRGIGVAFFEQREAHARRLGRFTHATFCAVERPADHPRRPAGYVPLDRFWRRRGFRPAQLQASFCWKDVGDTGDTAKPMRFWLKELAP